MTSKVRYEGNLRTTLTHVYSGTEIITDAPLDNQGMARSFSPTDLAASSLGACMMTVMGIKARDMNIDLTGTEIEITKVMGTEPRRITEIQVVINFKPNNIGDKERQILENTARTCPVAKSLHPDIKQAVTFNWR